MDSERRTFARFALDGDTAIMRSHCFLDNSETKTRSTTSLLGREERLKDLCRVVRLDAVTGIGDFNGHSARVMQAAADGDRFDARRPQTQRSTVRHGLKCVFNEVVQGFQHVLTICLNRRKVGGQFRNACHVLPFAFSPKETRTLPQAFVDVDFRPHRWSTSRIEQQILDDPRCALDLRFNRLQSSPDF